MAAVARVAGYETDRPDVPVDARSVLEPGCSAARGARCPRLAPEHVPVGRRG